MKRDFFLNLLFLLIAGSLAPPVSHADEPKDNGEIQAVYPLAILPFQEKGRETKDLGSKVTDLVYANLVTTDLYLVEREELAKILDEQELNLSGVVNPANSVQIGQLTGAKLLVTGSVLQVDSKMYLIVKIIGVETSRVLGASVKGKADDDLDVLAEKLAEEIVATIEKRADELVAKPVTHEDRLANLKEALGKAKRPKVWISIDEQHVGQATNDPAAETEVALLCTASGFEVIDPKEGDKDDADVLLIGEAFSEFATRRGNLVSVKGRLELKAVDRETGRVLAIDRQTTVKVDLTEQIAGKSALEEAGAAIAVRLLPKIVHNKDDAKKTEKDAGKQKPNEKKKKKERKANAAEDSDTEKDATSK